MEKNDRNIFNTLCGELTKLGVVLLLKYQQLIGYKDQETIHLKREKFSPAPSTYIFTLKVLFSLLSKKTLKLQGKIILFKYNNLQQWNLPFQCHLPQNTPAWVMSEPGSPSSLGLLWFVTIPVSAVIFKQPFIPAHCLLPTRVPV